MVSCSDGRGLEYATLGEPTGSTVFFHHGTPGSNRLVRTLEPLVRDGSLFLVSMSRAGYGLSTRLEGRDVASVVDDVRTVLDALGRTQYLSMGWSGGGPHALACAALDAPRCVGVLSLAGFAPYDADFDWTAGMGEENIEEFAAANQSAAAHQSLIEREADKFSVTSADTVIADFGGLFSEPDKAALAEESSRVEFSAGLAHGFADGWRGFYDDDCALMKQWGFDVSSITVPASLWFGGQDFMVPASHGQWLASHIDGSRVQYFDGDGHLSLLTNHVDELVEDLRRLV